MFETPDWKNSIEEGPEKGRGLDDYERYFAFDRQSLDGKIILDLGAGPGARFAKDLKAAGVDATVISLSPDYADAKQRTLLKPNKREKIKAFFNNQDAYQPQVIAGVGEQLPFGNESFDEILSLFSLTTYSFKNYSLWLPEAVRVLKEGGTFRVGPFRRTRLIDPEYKQESEEVEDFLKKQGWDYEFIEESKTKQAMLIVKKGITTKSGFDNIA